MKEFRDKLCDCFACLLPYMGRSFLSLANDVRECEVQQQQQKEGGKTTKQKNNKLCLLTLFFYDKY
jgi:hypothetical protein